MRVLQVVPFFAQSMGGLVAATCSLSRELVKRGHEVEVLTTDFELDSEFVESIRGEGIGVSLARCDLALGSFLVSPSIKPWLRARTKEFDIIHMQGFRSYQNNVVHAFAKRHHIPYLLQPHGSLLPFFEKQRLKLLHDFVWGRRILDEAAAVIALNRMEEKQCMSMGVKEDRIRIIPNGISTSEFGHLPERGALRTKFGIGPDWPVVLYLGRIHRIKGLDLLLAAFASLVEELKNIRLILAGPGDGFLSELESQARALGIEDRVIVTGPLYNRERLEAFVDADVYVLPSSYDMFPIAVLEAAACGKPVLSTPLPGMTAIIQGPNQGVVYADINEFAENTIRLLKDPSVAEVIGENGCRYARHEHDEKRIARRLEMILHQIITCRANKHSKDEDHGEKNAKDSEELIDLSDKSGEQV